MVEGDEGTLRTEDASSAVAKSKSQNLKNENSVMSLVAEHALKAEDYDACLRVCEMLMEETAKRAQQQVQFWGALFHTETGLKSFHKIKKMRLISAKLISIPFRDARVL